MLSEFNGIGPELMPKFGVGRLVFWGGVVLGGGVAVWRRGGTGLGGVAGWGWPCVLCAVCDVLLCIITKHFFQSLFAFLLSAAVSSQVSSFRFFAR